MKNESRWWEDVDAAIHVPIFIEVGLNRNQMFPESMSKDFSNYQCAREALWAMREGLS